MAKGLALGNRDAGSVLNFGHSIGVRPNLSVPTHAKTGPKHRQGQVRISTRFSELAVFDALLYIRVRRLDQTA
jgi:hypothetical protein